MFNSIAKPFGMLLMFLYELVANYGVAVILFAIVVKVILLPFQMKSKRGTMQSSRLQPQMAELQKKHGANKQKYNEELQKLYKEEGVNPASGCLWGILPLPIMLALYQAIRNPITIMMGVGAELLDKIGVSNAIADGAITMKLAELGFEQTANAAYGQIQQVQFMSLPENFEIFSAISDKLRVIDYNFLGMDLGAIPSFKVWEFNWTGASAGPELGPQIMLFVVALISGGLALAQSLINRKLQPPPVATGDAAAAGSSMKMMTYLMPLMSVYFAFIMPAALGIYWAASTILQIIQEVVLTKHYTKIMDAEAEVRNRARAERDAENERKREETERLKAEQKTEVNKSTSKKKLDAADKQEREAKAAEWEKKHTPPKEEPDQPARSGNRQFARGRAYVAERYGEQDIEPISDAEESEYDAEPVEAAAQMEYVDVEYEDADNADETGDAKVEAVEAEAAEEAKEADIGKD